MITDRQASETLFEAAYQRWIAEQIRSSSGERKRRLEEGLGHAEKLFVSRVWWPAIENFEYLHAEYEVYDFKDGARFLDFAYIREGLRLCIEIDPFGTHWSKISRWQFDDHLDRQNDLILDDWKVLRFSKDMIESNPRRCQQKIQQGLGKWTNDANPTSADDPIDHAILSLMVNRTAPTSPSEIARQLGWHRSTISRHMNRLAERQMLLSVNPNLTKNTRYVPNPSIRKQKVTPYAPNR